MSHRRPLPSDLAHAPFSTSEARDRGVAEHRLRAADLTHPFHGVIDPRSGVGLLRDRCAGYAPRLRDGQVFSHTTAVLLHGAPVPRRVEHEVHVSVAFPRTPPRTAGAIGHSLRRLDPTLLDGLPVSDAAAAWCESAAVLRREELVAVGDALVTGLRIAGVRSAAATDPSRLAAALRARPRGRGAGRAAWALPRIRTGVDSPRETELRLLLVRHRLPEPEADVPIEVAGRVLHADIAYPTARVLLEYEGDVHRVDRWRWMADIRRRELFEDAGFRVIRVVAADLEDPAPLIARVRRLVRGAP